MTDPFQMQKNAPNAVAALILGILSIVCGCFFVGLIFGIIGVVLASNGMKAYAMDPTAYKNVGMLNTGKVLSIIGIALGGISLIWAIISVALWGGSLFFLEDLLYF